MREILLSADAARRIVETGTVKRIVAKQTIRKPEYTPPQREESQLFFATVAENWEQNENRNAAIALTETTNGITQARSPLSRYRDALAAGTRILCVKINNTAYLVNAECPE